MNKKQLNFIWIDDTAYEVAGRFEDILLTGKFSKDRAYVKDDLVWIYGGKLKSKEKNKSGFFYKNGLAEEYVFVPIKPEKEKEHDIKNIVNSDTIYEKMNNPDNFKEVDREIVDNSDLKVFAPPVKEEDDLYKRIIKEVLQEKQIDLKVYKHKFLNEYDLTNLKASLTKQQALTVKNFNRWCEVLDLTVKLIVNNKGTDERSPLKEQLEYIQN